MTEDRPPEGQNMTELEDVIDTGSDADAAEFDPTGASDDKLLPRQRVRIVYAKEECIKFISHQDEFRAWERALRRAGLPILYKKGFNPQPHIQFASPLGVGFSGLHEIIDITFAPPVPLLELRRRLAASLPPGLTVHELSETPLRSPALQSLLIGADYTIRLYAENSATLSSVIERKIAELLQVSKIWRERERKGRRYRYNLRPLVLELAYRGYDPAAEEHGIFLRVQQRAGAAGRPDEVVSALGLDSYPRSLCRTCLYFEDNPQDVAVFAPYPIIDKADIAEQPVQEASRHQPDHKPGSHAVKGRTIGERAADEFI